MSGSRQAAAGSLVGATSTGMTPSFKQLLEQSRQLTNHISTPSIVTLDRGLEQIESQTKRLLKRTLADTDTQNVSDATQQSRIGPFGIDSRTAYLLAKRGFDVDKVSETLDQINLSLTFEPLEAVPDTNIDAFLANEHENMISLAIEETKNQTVADFERQHHQVVKNEWQNMKKRIFEDMGHVKAPASLVESMTDANGIASHRWDTLSESASVSGDRASKSGGGIGQNARYKAYFAVTEALNKSRLRGSDFDIFKKYKTATESLAVDAQQQFVHRCWDLLMYISKHARDISFKTPSALEDQPEFRNAVVHGGLEWLERIYRMWVTEHVRSHHVEIGGMPTVHDEVDSILKLQYSRGGRWVLPWLDLSIGKVPFWAHVYLLVRMGLRKDAIEYVRKYQSELSESGENKNFAAYFKAWCDSKDGRLPKSLRDSLMTEWNSSIRDYLPDANATPRGDLFKYTLYKLMGRCELNVKTIRNPDVIATTEDYLWIQMMLIQESPLSSESAFENYTLRDFSVRMQQFGLSHFKSTPVWFMVLILCGELELAVEELLKDNFFALDAMHFAIALAVKRFLRVPENPRVAPVSGGTLLSKKAISLGRGTSYNICYFHFARMIINFARDWIVSDSGDMLHYLYLIGLYGEPLDKSVEIAGGDKASVSSPKEYTRLAHSVIRDVVSASGNYATLLGQVRADGSGRVPGHIETYKALIHIGSDSDFMETMVLACAHDANAHGKIEDAIQLYHLGGQYNRVVDLLSQYLGEKLLQYGFSDAFATSSNGATSAIKDRSKSLTDASLPAFSLEHDPVDAAAQLLRFYMSKPLTSSSISRRSATTLETLIQLFRFRTLIEQSREEAALNILYQLNILPADVNMAEIQMKADAFKDLDESVARVMPNAMVLASQSLYNLYRAWSFRKGDFGDGAREARVKSIRDRSKALLIFAGLIQYRIPGDVFAKLNRIDVMMG